MKAFIDVINFNKRLLWSAVISVCVCVCVCVCVYIAIILVCVCVCVCVCVYIYIYIYIYTYTYTYTHTHTHTHTHIYINAKLGTNSTFVAGLRKTTENLLKHEICEINISNSVRTWQKRTRILHKDQMVTVVPFQWSCWLGDIPAWTALTVRSQFEACSGPWTVSPISEIRVYAH